MTAKAKRDKITQRSGKDVIVNTLTTYYID